MWVRQFFSLKTLCFIDDILSDGLKLLFSDKVSL